MNHKEQFLQLFPVWFRKLMSTAANRLGQLREIRVRAGRPVILKLNGKEWTILPDGSLSENFEKGVCISMREIFEMLEYLCGSSMYAYEEELKRGYLTVPGGHRIGIGGSVATECDSIKTFRYVSSMNIRIAHEIKGVADQIYPYLQSGKDFYNTLLISGPGLGKTTLLRDIVRQASEYGRFQVCVIDERSEVAGCYMGCIQNDLGPRTDVLDNCQKSEGMILAVRAMSPDIIAVDEIGSMQDTQAIRTVVRCGCRLIATVHGEDMEDIKNRPAMEALVQERVFDRYIVFEKRNNEILKCILNQNEQVLFQSV